VTLLALNDAIEEKEWGSVHMEVETTVRALTNALSSLHDVINPVGQVRYIHAFDLYFPFVGP
jgi:hypothetical protein